MKTETFERKDGSRGENYILEEGDRVTALFDKVREDAGGKFKNYSLGVKLENGKEVFVRITAGQAKSLDKQGKLKGKTLRAYSYENEYGKQTGIKAE